MRILHTLHWTKGRGSEKVILEIVKNRPYDVHFAVIRDDQSTTTVFWRDHQQYFKEWHALPEISKNSFDYGDKLINLIARWKPDVLHYWMPGGEPVPKAAKVFEGPTILSVLCPRRTRAEWGEVVQAVTVPSQFVANLQSNHLPVLVTPYGLDLPRADGDRLKRMLEFENKKIVARVSALSPVKKVDDFVAVAEKFRDQKDVVFIVSGFIDTGCEEWVKQLKLTSPPNVRWMHPLGEEDKLALYAAADAALLPTTQEAFGIVFLEAMSQDCPIVTYDDSANGEVIGATGVTISVVGPDGSPYPDCVEGLATAVQELISGGSLPSARQRYEALFTARHWAERIARVYEWVIERHQRMKEQRIGTSS